MAPSGEQDGGRGSTGKAPAPSSATLPDTAAPLHPGDPAALGPYTLVGRLGAGGMGTVYLGRAGDGPLVAVKVIRPHLAGDEGFLARFRSEVAAARRVAGSCTARVLDADLDAPRPYYVTEYVHGTPLDRAVARDGPLTASDLEGFAVGVAAALTAIHAAGLVHRDLKPGNVLLTAYGPRVIDFGIARALDAASSITQAGTMLGTPGWMAPEQLAGLPATPAADVFVWGSLVAFAGTGRHPFGQGPMEVLADRIRRGPPDLTGLPAPVRRVVEAAMAKEPERRPSARALLLDLLGDRAAGETRTDPRQAVTEVLERTWAREPATRPTLPLPPPAAWGPPGRPPPAPPPGWAGREPARPRRWYRRKLVTVPLAILLLAWAASLVDGHEGDGSPGRSTTATRAPGRARTPTPTASRAASPGIGSPVADGRLRFVVRRVRCGYDTIGTAWKRQANGQFCLVTLTVENIGERSRLLPVQQQYLYDEAGRRHEPDGWAWLHVPNALTASQLNPGSTVSGTLVYDVPERVVPVRLELHDSPFSRGASVDL